MCRQFIYNYPEQLFADAGVMAIEHADLKDYLVLGKLCMLIIFLYLLHIIRFFGNPEKVNKLGRCKLI